MLFLKFFCKFLTISHNFQKSEEESICKSLTYNKDFFLNDTEKLKSFTGQPLDPDALLSPCGSKATNFFNDRFKLFSSPAKKEIFINESDIAYESDKKYTFKRSADYNSTRWIDVTDEHFMVWMNMETFNDFHKKWGRIDQDLESGIYVLHVYNTWPVANIETKKYFMLSSTPGLGSASFFGWSLIKAGIISLISVFILIITRATQKNTFDETYLSWE